MISAIGRRRRDDGPGRWSWPPTRPVGLFLAALLTITGCSDGVGGAPLTTGPDFTARSDAAVATVLADLEDFWTVEQPAIGGPAFAPLAGGYHPVDAAAATGGALCVSRPAQITGNAFYCPDQDGLVWDSAALVPALYGRGGPGAVAAAFAHEFGHAIQARVGPTPAQRAADPQTWPTLLVEGQADCDAGAFLAWLRAGGSARQQLTDDQLLPALQLVLDFRDPPGMAATDPAAHGRGVDRLGFLLLGMRSGATACHAMSTTDLPLDRRTDTELAPRFPHAAAAVADSRGSLADLVDEWNSSASSSGSAPEATAEPDGADLRTAADHGQFAAATAAALATGRALTGSDTGAACVAGAWTATVVAQPTGGGLGGRAGDPDEALDLVRYRSGATFDQVAAFDDGWRGGLAACR